MLAAVIRSGDQTLVVELPTGDTSLQAKLNSIGISQTGDDIKLSNKDDDPIRVKLFATEPEEAHLLSLLTPDRTLTDANKSMMLLWQAEQRGLPRLKCSLLGDFYRSIDDFFTNAKQVFAQDSADSARSDALRQFEVDPNIRAVVSCTHDGAVEMYALPMRDRQLTRAGIHLEQIGGDGALLKIETIRYGKPEKYAKIIAKRAFPLRR